MGGGEAACKSRFTTGLELPKVLHEDVARFPRQMQTLLDARRQLGQLVTGDSCLYRTLQVTVLTKLGS